MDLAAHAWTHSGVVSSVGWLREISMSGGFFMTPLPIQPLATICLQLIDANGELGARLEGQVVRCVPQGLGIEWSEHAPAVIRDLIQHTRVAKTDRLSHEQLLALPELITFRYRALRALLRGRARARVRQAPGQGAMRLSPGSVSS